MRKLKIEYEKLASEKKREVSDLSRENGFVWSQLKCIEPQVILNHKSFSITNHPRDSEALLCTDQASPFRPKPGTLVKPNHGRISVLSSTLEGTLNLVSDGFHLNSIIQVLLCLKKLKKMIFWDQFDVS